MSLLPATIEGDETAAAKRRLLTEIATIIAIGFEDKDTIMQRRNITSAEFSAIEQNPYYQRVLTAATAEWHSPLNSERRLQLQAAWALEQGLPDYVARATNPNEDLGKVNEAMKVLMNFAGMNGRNREQGSGEKFLIQINIGEDHKLTHEVMDATPLLPAPEGE